MSPLLSGWLIIVASAVCLISLFAAVIPTVFWLQRRKNKKSSGLTPLEPTDQKGKDIWPPPPTF